MVSMKHIESLFVEMRQMDRKTAKTEVLSGLTVALALVPEAVAFAFVAQVNPLVGLYAAFMVGLITAVIGGRPGMISGATGALAVVMTALVVQHGVEYLFATVVLMGIIQLLAGLFRLGRFIRLVPHPVMLGFVNGLAIVICLAQFGQFKVPDEAGNLVWMQGEALYIMAGLIMLAMAIIHFLPRITKVIPSPLAAILGVFALTQILGIDTRSVGDLASISGGFPEFHIPMVPWNLETIFIIMPYAFILAGIGLIESLLTLNMVDEITETRGHNSQECIAQGTANICTGFFGGMGGCAMIGQSMINISSGARHRLSGIAAALFLLMFILFAAPVIEEIPLAALIGVMFMVVIGTFAWSSIRIMTKIPLMDAFVIVLVSAITVWYDLAIAVIIGVIVSALGYAWESAHHITAVIDRKPKKGTKTYEIYGPVFFGSIASFKDLFHPKHDPKKVVIDFTHSRVWDHSGLEALEKLADKYKALKKQVVFKGLSPQCAELLKRAGANVQRSKKDKHLHHYEIIVNK